ncbi:cytochrome P450 [Atractiella rhizophila]|nr:cytochrome P450 [Atractiella rhizophila]
MIDSQLPLLLLVTSLLLAFYLYPKKRSDLPPGPAPSLFLGNRQQVPKDKPWRWFRDLNLKYGDVVYLQMGGTPTIVLGSAKVAWELLEKRNNIYSGRPRFIMGQELLSDNLRGLMSSPSPFWRRWRKCLHLAFMSRAADAYKPIQSLESKQLLWELLNDGESQGTTGGTVWMERVERYAASVIVAVTYGRRVLDLKTDSVVASNNAAMTALTSFNIPGKYLVESLPSLLWLPNFLTPWRTAALKRREEDIKLYTGLVEEVKAKMKEGKAPESFCRTIIENQQELGMSDIEVAYTCSTPFGAGIETSSGTIAVFIMACVHAGETFTKKAQEELDRVVGSERMPDWGDLDELVYVKAVVGETFRWRPVAVLGGTPHQSTQDDVYNGMYIPKGTTVIGNLWSIHLNPTDFPDPDKFDPSRFLGTRDYPGAFGHSAFGWGRRICPGWPIGHNSVFLNVARMLWAFNILPALNQSGKPIPVDTMNLTSGFNSRPHPFPCRFQVRSAKHKEVVEREWAGVKEEVGAYER